MGFLHRPQKYIFIMHKQHRNTTTEHCLRTILSSGRLYFFIAQYALEFEQYISYYAQKWDIKEQIKKFIIEKGQASCEFFIRYLI